MANETEGAAASLSDQMSDLLFGLLAMRRLGLPREELQEMLQGWGEEGSTPVSEKVISRLSLDDDTIEDLRQAVAELLPGLSDTPDRFPKATQVWVERFESEIAPTFPLSSAPGRNSSEQDSDSKDVESIDFVATLEGVFSELWAASPDIGTRSGQGRFRSVSFHARGGLGEVHVAEDCEMHRLVALKQIRPSFADHPASRARFITEAEITGRLEHPSIVPIYGMGEAADGRPFYAMKFIYGESLQEKLKRIFSDSSAAKQRQVKDASDQPVGDDGESAPSQASGHGEQASLHSTWIKSLDQTNGDKRAEATSPNDSGEGNERRERQDSKSTVASWSEELPALLNHFLTVCQAIEYAHQRGVIHRDIKPANIMLGPYGETLVVDWGLAKILSVDSQAQTSAEKPGMEPIVPQTGDQAFETVQGRAIGTLPYASPEQVMGQGEMLGPASDIYSLGAMLYEILTGEIPFADNLSEIREAKQKGKIQPPKARNRQVSPQLNSICIKAMHVDPEKRYESAQALAEDISLYLSDRPVSAHQDSLVTKSLRWMRRHQSWVSSGVATLLVGLAAAAVLIAVLTVTNGKLEESNNRTQENFERAQLNAIDLASRRGEWEEAFLLIEEALKQDLRTIDKTELKIKQVKASYGRFSGRDYARLAKELHDSQYPQAYHPEIQLLYADALQLRNSDSELKELLKDVLNAPPEQLEKTDRLYAQAMVAESTIDAIDFLTEAVELDPYHLRAQHMLICNLLMLGRYDAVELQINTSRSIFPNDSNLDLLSAWRYANLGQKTSFRREVERLKGVISDDEYQLVYKMLDNLCNLSQTIMDDYDSATQQKALVQIVSLVNGFLSLRVSPVESETGPEVSRLLLSPGSTALQAYSEIASVAFNSMIQDGRVDDKVADRFDEFTSIHPDGMLFLIQGFIYFINEGRAVDAYRAFDRAANATSMLPGVQREAYFLSAMARAQACFVEDRKTPELMRETVYMVEQRLKMGPLKPLHSHYLVKLCFQAQRYDLIDEIVDQQLLLRPNDLAYLELKVRSLIEQQRSIEALRRIEQVEARQGDLSEIMVKYREQAKEAIQEFLVEADAEPK